MAHQPLCLSIQWLSHTKCPSVPSEHKEWLKPFTTKTLQSGSVTPHWFNCKPPIFSTIFKMMDTSLRLFEIIHTSRRFSCLATHTISRNYQVDTAYNSLPVISTLLFPRFNSASFFSGGGRNEVHWATFTLRVTVPLSKPSPLSPEGVWVAPKRGVSLNVKLSNGLFSSFFLACYHLLDACHAPSFEILASQVAWQ